ncbi:MAG: type IV pilus modification protein PilV [Burkholderiaceae bacterium]
MSMIEVLVAIVILAIGLLGLAGLQLRAMATNQGALYRAQATLLADEIVERMRGNLNAAQTYGLTIDAAAPTGSEVRDRDLADWRLRLQNTLPDGVGAVTINTGTEQATVLIQWNDSRAARGNAIGTHTLVARIWNDNR